MSHVVVDEQRTDEWQEARLGRATASRFADVLAKTRTGESSLRRNYKSELVIERLTGQRIDAFSSKAMEWGTDMEELARTTYMLRTGNVVSECGFYAHDELMTGASPDGLISDNGGIEIKCPNSATHIETLRAHKIPAKYVPQVHGQMWIANLEWVDFVSFDPRMPAHAQIFIQRITRDDDYIANLEAAVVQFLREVDEDVEFIKNYGKQPKVKEVAA